MSAPPYDFSRIEAEWQERWAAAGAYRVTEDPDKPKCYVLDMFPYPSGAGLHVGHPMGYIATDVYSRFKRQTGHAVLHPMGFDAFGLPAEQYAIETGQHPAVTTERNIATFIGQLKRIGFDYDWDRSVTTCDPGYYRWTQWIFSRLYEAWFDPGAGAARPIGELEERFARQGGPGFTHLEWRAMDRAAREAVLMDYRLAYLSHADVNWCPALGTVLANDEVKDGLSERGGHPVVRKRMRQWFLRITAYAERLLRGLDELDWTNALKEQQRNWIGRSEGARITFRTAGGDHGIEVFTTRPDTLFGATFMVLAPEHELVEALTTPTQRAEVDAYREYVQRRSERERLADTKTVSGAFTGAYAVHPVTGGEIPIWTAEYVLAGYGTGAIMAVPSDDERDHAFATHFGLPIVDVVDRSEGGTIDPESVPRGSKEHGLLQHSGFLDGLRVPEAIQAMLAYLEREGLGQREVNYRLRDAGFSRQRYWGEPFPVVYRDGVPELLPDAELPLELPEVASYQPTGDGRSPVAAAMDWVHLPDGAVRETDTMPGYAGSSWYWLRYMDPGNAEAFVSPERERYWGQVDLYVGGTEHAVGHLMYSRFVNHVLHDLGHVSRAEPFRKLVNQGMIQGRSSLVYRVNGTNTFVSQGRRGEHETTALHVDIRLVDNDVLDLDGFRAWREEYRDAEFLLEEGPQGPVYRCGSEVEKMSKRWYNVVNPDDVCDQYGTDTLRLYELFLGPFDQPKPWDTRGIDGAHRFLRKLWRLVTEGPVDEAAPSPEALKALHKAIDKVRGDIERLAFNTAISAMMTALNELTALGARQRGILEPLVVLLSPFAPHVGEELWRHLGHDDLVVLAAYPEADPALLVEDTHEYPVSVNGKVRDKVALPLSLDPAGVEAAVLGRPTVQKWLDGKAPRKVIVVPGRIVNVVV
jgi:leucyl-tRNA synthetase